MIAYTTTTAVQLIQAVMDQNLYSYSSQPSISDCMNIIKHRSFIWPSQPYPPIISTQANSVNWVATNQHQNQAPKYELSPWTHTSPAPLELVIALLTQIQTVAVISIQKHLDIAWSVLAASIAVDNVARGLTVSFDKLVIPSVLDK